MQDRDIAKDACLLALGNAYRVLGGYKPLVMSCTRVQRLCIYPMEGQERYHDNESVGHRLEPKLTTVVTMR